MITGRDPLRGSPEEFIFRNSRIPIRFLDGPDAFPGEPAAIPCMYSADSKKISNYNLGRDNPTRLRNLGRWRGAGPTGRSRSFGEPEPFIRILGSECLGLRHFGVCGPVFLILQTGKWFRYCRRTSSTCAWAAVPPARRRGEGVIATPSTTPLDRNAATSYLAPPSEVFDRGRLPVLDAITLAPAQSRYRRGRDCACYHSAGSVQWQRARTQMDDPDVLAQESD